MFFFCYGFVFFPVPWEEGGGCTPQRGGVCSSWKKGERLRPTFLFLSREKKKRADLRAKSLASLGCAPKRACGRRPGTKKKSAWSGFRDESCFFFACALRPDGSTLVLCGLVLPLTPLPLTGVGGLLFYVEKSGFHSESRLIYCSKMYSISFAAERLFFSASALICSSSSVLIRIVKRV